MRDKRLKNKRITLTLPVINRTRNIIFLVTGKGKAVILSRVFKGEQDLPAARVFPNKKKIFFLVDESAYACVRKERAFCQ